MMVQPPLDTQAQKSGKVRQFQVDNGDAFRDYTPKIIRTSPRVQWGNSFWHETDFLVFLNVTINTVIGYVTVAAITYHYVKTTSFWRNHVKMTFWRYNDVIITSCVQWGPGTLSTHHTHCIWKIKALGSWWRHQMETFSALLALCAGNSPVPVNSPHKGQWRGALMFSLICAWIVNHRKAGDLRRHRAHYDVTVMLREVVVIL